MDIKELAGLVFYQLERHGLSAVLVGGSCVSIYTENHYESFDLDLVTYEKTKNLEKALSEIGFSRAGRYYTHPNSDYFIEFISPPVAIGDEPITDYEYYQIELGVVKMLTPTDCIRDRLADYYYWNDLESLNQAILVAKSHFKSIKFEEIKKWSIKESFSNEYKEFVLKMGSEFSDLRGI